MLLRLSLDDAGWPERQGSRPVPHLSDGFQASPLPLGRCSVVAPSLQQMPLLPCLVLRFVTSELNSSSMYLAGHHGADQVLTTSTKVIEVHLIGT